MVPSELPALMVKSSTCSATLRPAMRPVPTMALVGSVWRSAVGVVVTLAGQRAHLVEAAGVHQRGDALARVQAAAGAKLRQRLGPAHGQRAGAARLQLGQLGGPFAAGPPEPGGPGQPLTPGPQTQRAGQFGGGLPLRHQVAVRFDKAAEDRLVAGLFHQREIHCGSCDTLRSASSQNRIWSALTPGGSVTPL
jgi:hypothetical protein